MNDSEIIWKYDDCLFSKPENANALVREVIARLNELGWPEKDVFAIHMALEEALMNAIKHGNGGDEAKKVDVKMSIRPDHFYARIEDEGSGFDLEQVPDPCDDANLQKPSGRGVALIKNFVDFVEYNAAGNMVEFTKTKS